ncbi:MAG: tRNA adenosine(34) deaminase TadA [Myxococcota bacterium]
MAVKKTVEKSADDERFMRLAIEAAREAGERGDVPVGAVIVKGGTVLASSGNRRHTEPDPTAHAEIVVMREAAKIIGNWRLDDCALYVTLEPCPMCAGAMVNARLPRLVYGAPDPRAGAVESLYKIVQDKRLNHRIEVSAGVLSGECADILSEFFAKRRRKGTKD